jgi:hypothetical protein
LVCVHSGALIWTFGVANRVEMQFVSIGAVFRSPREFAAEMRTRIARFLWFSLSFWPVELEDRAGCVVRELDSLVRAKHF